MTKKIVALILILPMLLMMTLFTAVNTVSLSVSVAVEKIQIFGDGFVSLDMDKNERYFVDYAVYPSVATNKEVFFTVEQVGNQKLAQLEYKDGFIYPKEAGVANACLTTVDGGFRDKFQVVVKAVKLRQIDCTTEKSWLYIGETMQINTQFIPSSTPDKTLEYTSSNEDVLTVDDNGVITAKAKGNATVVIWSNADETVQDSLEITVDMQGTFSLAQKEITTAQQNGSVGMTVLADQDSSLDYGVYDIHGNLLDGVIVPADESEPFVELGNGNYRFDYKFIDADYCGTIVIKFALINEHQNVERFCTVTKIEAFEARFNDAGEIMYTAIGKTFNWKNYVTVSPEDAKVEYSVNFENNNLAVGAVPYLAKANKLGVTKATITIKNQENENQTVVLEKQVCVHSEEIYIKENVGVEYGIENVWTIGKYNANEEEIERDLTLFFGADEQGERFDELKEKIEFKTNSPKVTFQGQTIKIADDSFTGIVDITASLDTGSEMLSSESFKVRCVGNGVEVDNFIDLHRATKNNKVVVLTDDIVDDFGVDAQGNNFYQGENIDRIESTYDVKYYQNIGSSNTKIITLLQFRKDLYGNGHIINANNVTNVSDSDRFQGKALFNGPLNFVAMSDSGSSLVSVKGQDNVCFAVYENTTINNVELKGCTMESSAGTYDLTDLDYVGTVVEVLGDNVNIEYSRINNGRTVLRAFGDIEGAEKVINVNVKNCVLDRAREFVIKMGSNLIKRDTRTLETLDNYQVPSLDENDDFNFPVYQDYKKYTDEQKSQYEDKNIKTFVNVENSVLKDSGIFCVGMDSHFAGSMLYDAVKVFPNFKDLLCGWTGISGTSYGAKLTFSGDVRIYDWKNVENIDSSTLIENNAIDQPPYNSLRFNIKEMIEKLGNTSMIYQGENEKQYVHGGIVFFGGGKNYSVFEQKGESFTGLLGQGTTIEFNDYKVSLKDVDKAFMEKASGDKPFYFTLYGANSTFTPDVQETILKSNNAYNCIYFTL